jgi:NAD(P)-dependent dehydrogenase (short-subunit alcohol dehydrogenase family)
MPLDSLKGRHVAILGGSDGIGYATAAYLLRSGAIVTICGRTEGKLAAARERMLSETEVPADHLRSAPVDARDFASVDEVVALAANADGQLDGIFVVAGGSGYSPVEEHTTDFVAEEWANNLFPLTNAIRAAVPRMKAQGGSIVGLSSVAAIQTLQGLAAYNAAKAGLEQYVRTAADELGQYRIRVNAVRPGFTNTGATAENVKDEDFLKRFRKITPLGVYGEPEDFGPIVSLLLIAETRWITGQIFSIDGGLSLRGYGGPAMTGIEA